MKRHGLTIYAAICLVCLAQSGCWPANVEPAPRQAYEELQAEAFARHVGYLADPSAGGRMTGTAGNSRAVEYVRKEFGKAGLNPAGQDGTWFQTFPVGSVHVPTDQSRLKLAGGNEFVLWKDFAPMASGCQGRFEGTIVFAGYGLHNHVRGYNDYANIDAKGAVVIVFQGEPHGETGKSKWAAGDSWTHLTSYKYKIELAAEKGAAAILLVTPPDISPSCDPLDDVLGRCSGPIPAMRISRDSAQKLLDSAGQGQKLDELMHNIHDTHKPVSYSVGGRLDGNASMAATTGRNIVGMLPATAATPATAPAAQTQPAKRRTIVLCAHYDHIPATGQLAIDKGFGVRPGADDNASGVAALIMLANALSKLPERPYNIIFLAAGAEELGFYGSRHFIDNPAVPADKIAFMLNFDQVGFIRNNTIYVLGAVNNPALSHAIAAARKYGGGITPVYIPISNTKHWSDQAPFAEAGYKTLFFFAGLTEHRHTRTDLSGLVNNDGAAKTVKLAFEIIRNIPANYTQKAGKSLPGK
ncbi:MAG: M20/M25/M40 family metallo-hydrolase [Planctomycetes bacterium]|nr:M20/M25/M40 family metallo-hydrolase [Planctomycetota bacterium]